MSEYFTNYDRIRKFKRLLSSTGQALFISGPKPLSYTERCQKFHLNEPSRLAGCNGLIFPYQSAYHLTAGTSSQYYMHLGCAEAAGLQAGMRLVRHGVRWRVVSGTDDTARYNREIESIPLETIRTQKAAGINVLERSGKLYGAHNHLPTMLIQSTDEVEHINEEIFELEVKARPCPKRPRHGGVPSRVVANKDELRQVWQRAQEEDPEAELLIQPNIRASHNYILTGSTLSYGPGCDGATAGKDSRLLRLGPGQFQFKSDEDMREMFKEARLEPGQEGYIEAVRAQDRGELYIVQLRGGPQVPATRDYVPHEMRVESVYTLDASSDNVTEEKLLAWERLLPTLGPGSVVYHPRSTITSHYGVQCLTHGIPYVTSFEPRVGQVLEPQGDYEQHDYDAVRDGMHAGLHSKLASYEYERDYWRFQDHTLAPIFAIHNAVVERSQYGSWLLGFSAARLWRMMAMACVGEMRHFRGSHRVRLEWETQNTWRNDSIDPPPWMPREDWDPEPWLKYYLRKYGSNHAEKGRDYAYNETWPMSHQELLGCLTASTRSFLTHHWSNGMGGLNWGRSGLCALELYEAMTHVSRRPTKRAISQLVSRANKAVNLVHNGGKLLNKFADDKEIDRAARLDRGVLLHSVTPFLLDVDYELTQPAAPAMEEKPRLWRLALPRELVKYAKSEDACKRWEHPTGSLKIAKEQEAIREAAIAVGYTFFMLWPTFVKDCYFTLGDALYRSYTDAVLYEIEQREAEAEALRKQLLKIRAELRKRRKEGGYQEEKPVKKSKAKKAVDVVDVEVGDWKLMSLNSWKPSPLPLEMNPHTKNLVEKYLNSMKWTTQIPAASPVDTEEVPF